MRPTDRTVKKEGMLISAQSIGAVLFNNHEMLISAYCCDLQLTVIYTAADIGPMN